MDNVLTSVKHCSDVPTTCVNITTGGKKGQSGQAVAVHTFNSSTPEAKAGRSLWAQDQPDLHREFQDSQGCHTEKHGFEKPNQKKNPKPKTQKQTKQTKPNQKKLKNKKRKGQSA